MHNRFENLYGVLFRRYAKSIIEKVSEISSFADNELLTIGILQYNPYDNSFYYAPTLKNVFQYPYQITDEFPTSKEKLWDFRLMSVLASYLASRKSNDWVEEIFSENEVLEENKVSIFASSYHNYKNFRNEWLCWYKNNKEKFNKTENKRVYSKADKIFLNQLFYFSNYLMTILRRPAFVHASKEPLSNAESIYLCINNHELLDNLNEGFNRYTAILENAIHLKWNTEIDTGVFRAELIFVLEVCFKQPFGVKRKIDIIKNFTRDKTSNSECYINAAAIPIIASGEFLGISYIAWPSESFEKSKSSYGEVSKKIRGVLKDSRIASFLYKARFSSTRFYLNDNTQLTELEKNPVQRIFELAHIFSSAHVIAYIQDDAVQFRLLYKNGNTFEIKSLDSSKSKKDLFVFLAQNINSSFDVLEHSDFLWLDVVKEDIKKQEKRQFYSKAKDDIQSFTTRLKAFIDDTDFQHVNFYNITHVSLHKFTYNGKVCNLIFFNTNYYLLFSITSDNAKLVRESYASEMFNYLNELIEDEIVHRRVSLQESTLRTEMDRGFFHYVKSTLDSKHNYIMNISSFSNERKLELIRQNDGLLKKRMKQYLDIYDMGSIGKSTDAYSILKAWNEKAIENEGRPNVIINQVTGLNLSENYIVSGCINSIDMVFEEFFINVLKTAMAVPSNSIELSLKVEREPRHITVIIINEGSTIPENKRQILGRNQISSTGTDSAGFGFTIMQALLKRMGALEYDKINFEIVYNDDLPSFQFKFKLRVL